MDAVFFYVLLALYTLFLLFYCFILYFQYLLIDFLYDLMYNIYVIKYLKYLGLAIFSSFFASLKCLCICFYSPWRLSEYLRIAQ